MLNSAWAQQHRNHFESILTNTLSTINSSETLLQAMQYSTLNAGKRLRPLLVYASGALFKVEMAILDQIACALEMIHAYSLIHDDLPAMDNDDYRRGKLTCHRAFNEATAILAGDALLTESFCLLSRLPHNNPITILNIIRLIADAAGKNGMVGGQSLDLQSQHTNITYEQLIKIHQLKTGALISACILSPALAAETQENAQHALTIYAHHLGLAFQIQDDILDVESHHSVLGKTTGKDQVQQKATYPALLGMTQAKATARNHVQSACTALDYFNDQADSNPHLNLLRNIAEYVILRQY